MNRLTLSGGQDRCLYYDSKNFFSEQDINYVDICKPVQLTLPEGVLDRYINYDPKVGFFSKQNISYEDFCYKDLGIEKDNMTKIEKDNMTKIELVYKIIYLLLILCICIL